MAYENIVLRKRNMTMVDGYFYSIDEDQDALIVKTDDGKLKLEIIYTFECCRNIPFFNKLRGSAPFIEYNGYLVGIAHFSEETKPRHYFHMMVDENLKFSKPFFFENLGIEFCIGFTITDKYHFWISQMDREPLLTECARMTDTFMGSMSS